MHNSLKLAQEMSDAEAYEEDVDGTQSEEIVKKEVKAAKKMTDKDLGRDEKKPKKKCKGAVTKAFFEKQAEKFKKDVNESVKEAVMQILTEAFEGKEVDLGKVDSLAHIQKDDPEFAKEI